MTSSEQRTPENEIELRDELIELSEVAAIYGDYNGESGRTYNRVNAVFDYIQSNYIPRKVAEREFKRGQRVGQYQAADKLYSYVTTMWMFKDDTNPKLNMPELATDMLKDCEKYMNHNRKVYVAYVAQLKAKQQEGEK